MIVEIRDFAVSKQRKKLIFPVIKNLIIIISLSWLFYDNILIFLLLIPIFLLLLYQDINKIKEQESCQRLMEFQDMLVIISQSIQVGSSIENAFVNAADDLVKIYHKDSVVMQSIYRIIYGLQMNVPIEKLVDDMAEQIPEEDVHVFASVFFGANKSGADLLEVIAFTADSLSEKISNKRETEQIISSKKTEQNIMNLVPVAILSYIKLCSNEFIAVLYHCPSGVAIMTFLLLIYLCAYLWSVKIMKIGV